MLRLQRVRDTLNFDEVSDTQLGRLHSLLSPQHLQQHSPLVCCCFLSPRSVLTHPNCQWTHARTAHCSGCTSAYRTHKKFLHNSHLSATFCINNMRYHTPNTNIIPNKMSIIPAKEDIGALSNRINSSTRGLHDKVDKMVTFRFALALRDAKVYRQGLQSFYHVFALVETNLMKQLEKENDPYTEMLKQVWRPEVARRDRAEQDLLFYYDDHKEKFVNAKMPEQIAFINHILEVTAEKPYLLFAYLHVMYLALFAGGRMMRSSFAKATGLFPQKDGLSHEQILKMGTNFFVFDVEDEEVLRADYKRDYELVTRGGLTEVEKLEIIEESKYIFAQNAKCIQELETYNMQRITQKWSYVLVTKGTYALIAVLAVLFLLYVRRLVGKF